MIFTLVSDKGMLGPQTPEHYIALPSRRDFIQSVCSHLTLNDYQWFFAFVRLTKPAQKSHQNTHLPQKKLSSIFNDLSEKHKTWLWKATVNLCIYWSQHTNNQTIESKR